MMNQVKRQEIVGVVSALIAIALLFVYPPVGFIAVALLVCTIAPWGRTLSERAIVSVLVGLTVIAVVFPRNGSTPINADTARFHLVGLLILVLVLRAIPRLRVTPWIPRVRLLDFFMLGFFLASTFWLLSSYIGTTDYETLSGMFFTGWDNQGHFITFSNTYAVGSTTWPTIDGSEAFNQWYPSLHTTAWSIGQYAFGGAGLSRIGLLFPYITWQAISFAACIAALSWMAGDVAQRVTGKKFAGALGFILAALFVTLGSPPLMFNAGFSNFIMGVTVVALASYISTTSAHTSKYIGWFVIPCAAIVSINLWTPLVLGLIPAGLVVLHALWLSRKSIALAWLAVSGLIAGWLAYTQAQAIIRPGGSAGELNSEIGAVGVGMPAFNISLALAMPVLALALIFFTSKNNRLTAIGIAGPPVFFTLIGGVFALGADSSNVSRIASYYVLKALDGALIAYFPIVLGLVAVITVKIMNDLRFSQQVVVAFGVILIGTVAYGYVGTTQTELSPGFTAAPGIQASKDRKEGVANTLIGEAILRSAEVAAKDPDWTPFMWDGSGTLPNLWVNSLTGVLSTNQQKFYANLPPFPYEEPALDYVNFALQVDGSLDLNVLWFRDVSGELLNGWAATKDSTRVMTSRVLIPSSPLCIECSLG